MKTKISDEILLIGFATAISIKILWQYHSMRTMTSTQKKQTDGIETSRNVIVRIIIVNNVVA